MAAQSVAQQVAALHAAGLTDSQIDAQAGVSVLGAPGLEWVSGHANVAKIDALLASLTTTPTPVAVSTTTRTARCEHSDTDNHGICYSCGHYDRGADAGRVIRRYTTGY